jgi:hypothetical protein
MIASVMSHSLHQSPPRRYPRLAVKLWLMAYGLWLMADG